VYINIVHCVTDHIFVQREVRWKIWMMSRHNMVVTTSLMGYNITIIRKCILSMYGIK